MEEGNGKRGGDLLLTVGKLSAVFALVVSLTAWVFGAVVDTKITQLKLELSSHYAQKAEVLDRREYEIRNAETARDIGRLQAVVEEQEKRLSAIREALDGRGSRK